MSNQSDNTVEPPIKDPPSKEQPPIMDTELGTKPMAVVLFSLRSKDNLCIKDKEAAPKVSFIQRLHCMPQRNIFSWHNMLACFLSNR